MTKTAIKPSYWDAKWQRRREFCGRFVAEHHPAILAEASLKPISGPGTIRDGVKSNWWFNTNASMTELGLQYVGYLFDRHKMLDHNWAIGRSEQEPWAVVSEPYDHIKRETIEQLRRELDEVGVELIEYPSEQSTHAPGHTLLLVADVVNMDTLMGAVGRIIVADCGPGESATLTRKRRKEMMAV